MRRLLVLAVAALVSLPLLAQNTDIESLSGLQFNFGNPGARSLGMGGAFIGLADDASAAEANPAGLTVLRKPEISFEGRNYLQQQTLTTSGTFPDLLRTDFNNYSDRVELTFGSFVIPVGSNFTIGGYYHEPLRNSGSGSVLPTFDPLTNRQTTDVPEFYLPAGGPAPVSLAQCQAIVDQTGNPLSCVRVTIKPFVTAVDIRQRTFGIAGAWKMGNFSVGATARYQRFDETSFTFRLTPDFDFDSISVQATSGKNSFKPQSEHDITYAAGVKWAPVEKFSMGAVYKQGATFEAPIFQADASTGLGNFTRIADTQFHFPDIYGAGISLAPIPVLRLNLDAVRVTYSHLADQFVSTSSDLVPISNFFQVDDVTELHAGAEYFFALKVPIAIRGGFWRDPAHALEWRGPLNGTEQVAAAILFPKGEAQNHWSVGAGLAWPKFQIDAAYDSSKHYKVGSLSFVTRF